MPQARITRWTHCCREQRRARLPEVTAGIETNPEQLGQARMTKVMG